MILVTGQMVKVGPKGTELVICKFNDPDAMGMVVARVGRFTHITMIPDPQQVVIEDDCPIGAMWMEAEWPE